MNNKGVILFLVIIFSLMLSLVGLSFIYMAGSQEISSMDDVLRTRALYVAEAGVERAIAWLENDIAGEYKTTSFQPFPETVFEAIPIGAQGKYRVTIIPNPNNTGNIDKKYLIISSGIVANVTKVVKVDIELNDYMRYAYFSDQEIEGCAKLTAPSWMLRNWFVTPDEFRGRVHSNDEISICGAPKFAKGPDGLYLITTAADFLYFNRKPNTRLSGGAPGSPLDLPYPTYGVSQYINMFKKWDIQLEHLKSVAKAKGLYYNNPQTIEIRDTSIVHNGAIVSIPNSDAVVFVDGDISRLSSNSVLPGLSRPLTIVSSGTVYITGNIKYNYDALNRPLGILGVISTQDIRIDDAIPITQNVVNMDGVYMSFRGLYAEDWASRFMPSNDPKVPNPPQGQLIINGGLIIRIRNTVGTAYASAYSDKMKTGYKKLFIFDTRLVDTPPPHFPRCCVIKRKSWEEEGFKRG